MHFAGRMKLRKFLEMYKDGFTVPDYHGGFHWHFSLALVYDNNIFDCPKEGFGRFILKGDRIVDGYQRLAVIAMKLKCMSAISPVIFDSLIKENFFIKQVWNMMTQQKYGLSIYGLEKWLENNLILFELDDYDDEEDIYWRLKIEQTRETNIRELPYPYHYMETHAYWHDKEDYENYFSMVGPEEFEKLRIGVDYEIR